MELVCETVQALLIHLRHDDGVKGLVVDGNERFTAGDENDMGVP